MADHQQHHHDDVVMARVRERQWIYLGPIMAAPMAHWAVTLYRSAKTRQQQQLVLGVGVIGSTLMTLTMRLYLMYHAGYPAGTGNGMWEREKLVTIEEQRQLENPSIAKIASEAFRGFG